MDPDLLWEPASAATGEPLVYLLYQAARDQAAGGGGGVDGGHRPPYIGRGATVAERAHIVIKGVVLRETETKESDKILTLLTAERGRLSVIARGARRRSCKFAASAQHLAWSEWTLYQKGDWYYVNEGTTLELFTGLRTDLEPWPWGCYLRS